ALLMEAARTELPNLPVQTTEPSSMGRLYFRTLVAQYARKDTVADLSAGNSECRILVVPTNEEIMIAREAYGARK
ncbi:MAG: hypothetical protein WCI43_05695, partial [Candidatus Firestonebacteria bacterium]